MGAKVVRGDKLLVDFKSNVVIDRITCELSAATGVKDGLVSRETIAEISEESPHSIVIWGPLDGDGWEIDAQEFLRHLQNLVSAMNERREGPAGREEDGCDDQ